MTLFVLLFYIILSAAVMHESIHDIVPFYYLVLGFVTFLLYAKDKHASKHHLWRVPENRLHLFSLLGGWTGAVMGQKILRHKRDKQPFKMVFIVSIFINILLLFLVIFILKNFDS